MYVLQPHARPATAAIPEFGAPAGPTESFADALAEDYADLDHEARANQPRPEPRPDARAEDHPADRADNRPDDRPEDRPRDRPDDTPGERLAATPVPQESALETIGAAVRTPARDQDSESPSAVLLAVAQAQSEILPSAASEAAGRAQPLLGDATGESGSSAGRRPPPTFGQTQQATADEGAKAAPPAAAKSKQSGAAPTPSSMAASMAGATARPPSEDLVQATARHPAADVMMQVTKGETALLSVPAATLGGAASLTAEAMARTARSTRDSATATDGRTKSAAKTPTKAPTPGQAVAAATPSAQNGTARQPSFAATDKTTGDAAAGAGQRALPTAAASFPFAMTAAAAPAAGSMEAAVAELRPAAGSPAQQVAIQINRSVATGGQRISVNLHPAELGRVEVELRMSEDGALKALIIADRSETLDLLQRDARSLERALQDAGVKTDPGSLSFNLRGEGQAGERGRAAAEAPATPRADDDPPGAGTEAAALRRHDGTLDLHV